MLGFDSIWQLGAIVALGLVVVVPCWRIARKSGFHGALALLMAVPLVNVALLWAFAFVRWPNERPSRRRPKRRVKSVYWR